MCECQDVYTQQMQNAISQEFLRLKDVCYLDHAGATLYADSQIKAVSHDLCENVYGNPHSFSTSSRYATDVVDQVRYQVLKHFSTDPSEYSVVFTSGSTAALKLVAESFHWTGEHSAENGAECRTECSLGVAESEGVPEQNQTESIPVEYDGLPGAFVYLQDNHTSVLGMRELAHAKDATIKCLSNDTTFDLLNGNGESINSPDIRPTHPYSGNSLFVYPAQCNFSGVKYPLSWIDNVKSGFLDSAARENGAKYRSNWFCMLDAASFVATNQLDLSEVKPDFVCLSFYKIFGYPTGLGALLVKNSSAAVLKKTYFGGGTVQISLSSERFHVPRTILHDNFEDGTVPFLSIISLRHGFATLRRLVGDMATVSRHTLSLARHVHRRLLEMHHENGAPVATLYADTDYEDSETQGGVVNFNLLRPSGEHVGFVEVLNMANLFNIQLRTGCFCNPGACRRHLRLSVDDLRSQFQAGHVCGDEKDLIAGMPTGSVRISFGYMSTRNDADQLLAMIRACFVQGNPIRELPDWWEEFRQAYRHKFRAKTRNQIDRGEDQSSSKEQFSSEKHLRSIQHSNSNKPPGSNQYYSSPEHFSSNGHSSSSNRSNSTEHSSSNYPTSVSDHSVSNVVCNASEQSSTRKHISSNGNPVSNKPKSPQENTNSRKHSNPTGDDNANERNDSTSEVIHLSRISLYPVKSCGAWSPAAWWLGPRGLRHDREWMVVAPSGVALTQKREAAMCMVKPTLDVARRQLRLDFPGMETVVLPLDQPEEAAGYPQCQSKVCGDRVRGWDCGDRVAQWLSDALNREGLRMIRQWTSDPRLSKRKDSATPGKATSAPVLSLSNQAQYLLLNAGTVAWLRDAIAQESRCEYDDEDENLLLRFRANLVVSGAGAFRENGWTELQVGGNRFRCEGPCTRCQMVCIDQTSGQKTSEPLGTLAAAFHGRMRFGIYLSRVAGDGKEETEIAVGDEVVPIRAGDV